MFNEMGGFVGVEYLFGFDNLLIVLFCVMDVLVIGVFKFCCKYGLMIGEDVIVIGYDGFLVGVYLDLFLIIFL